MNPSPMQSEAKSAPFIKQYWSLLLPLGFTSAALIWLVVSGMALVGQVSPYWMYLHLDSTTSQTAFLFFSLLALMILVGLLLRALLRRKAAFRWRALLLSLIIALFALVGFGFSEYESIQPLASAAFDGHSYQWLEYQDFMDPHYTLLDCDPGSVVCHAVYRYNLAHVCNLADPRASSVQTISQNRSTALPTLRVNPTAGTIEAQLNERTFFTYDIATQRGIGPC